VIIATIQSAIASKQSWNDLVAAITEHAPFLASLPCLHEPDSNVFLHHLEIIAHFMNSQVESASLFAMSNPMATLILPVLNGLVGQVAAMEGLPLQVQLILQSLEGSLKKLAVTTCESALNQSSADENVNEEEQKGNSIHDGVTCDGCNTYPIYGNRYKCMICENYDLCEACEASGKHPKDHEMLKCRGPLKSFMLSGRHPPRRWKHSQCPWRRIWNSDEEQISSPSSTPAKQGISAKFIRDSNLPDKTIVSDGQMHVKTWIMRNNGSEQWPAGTKLVYVSGNSELLLDGQTQFDVPQANCGQVVEVNAVIQTLSTKPGNYRTVFRLAKADGEQFGDFIWVELIISKQ